MYIMSSSLNINDIFFNTLIERKISLRPELINENFENNLETYVKNIMEGRCIKEGYVLPNSIKIFKRSIGSLNNNQFNGNIIYNVRIGAKICNIPSHSVINAKIKKINKLGILAFLGPLLIIVPRELHKNKSNFDKLTIDDYIDIFVVGKTYTLRSKNISVYGKLNMEVKKKITISKNLELKNKNENENYISPEDSNFEELYEESESSKEFDEESNIEKEDSLEDELMENMEDLEEELNEENFPNELDEEISENEFSEEDSTELDGEITL